MRLGLFIPQGWRLDLAGIEPAEHWATMQGLAAHADGGDVWESLWVYDHFHTVPEPTQEATYEAWTTMAALAASTRRIRLGQMCTCMGYRNPAYLAKVAATVDVISGGRVEMGIGGGWYEHEWRAYGYRFPRAGERLGMLDEGVQIMRQLWSTGRATLDGKHYQVDGALSYPLPLQDGGIPLWIAGGGEKKTLRIAAAHARYTNFDASPEVFAHKSEVLRGHCADLGRDFDEITRTSNVNVVLGATQADLDERLAWLAAHYREVLPERAGDLVAGLRGFGTGTVDEVIDQLRDAARRGVGYLICYFPDAAYDRSSIELFERAVAPALR